MTGSPPSTPTAPRGITTAVFLLWLSGGTRFIISAISAARLDWPAILGSSPMSAGLTTVGVVVGAMLGVGAFVCLPIGAAVEARALRRMALPLATAQFGFALVGIAPNLWLGVPLAIAQAAAFMMVIRHREELQRTKVSQRYSLTLGYILLVGGGLIGFHNFYLKRAWAGVLSLALVTIGALAWGGLIGYLCIGGLILLLAVDAIALPSRVSLLQREWIPRHRRL